MATTLSDLTESGPDRLGAQIDTETTIEPAGESAPADDGAQINALVSRGQQALAAYSSLTQEQIDYIVKKASVAALDKHGELAQVAVAETGRGVFEDKAVKNIFACEHVAHSMATLRTVGVIGHDELTGITEIAEPVGVVCGVTPVTNPTSTVIFKALICLKTRNPIVFAFHPSAQECSVAAARVVRDAAIAAGAPEGCVQWVEHPSIEATSALMNHDVVALVLATGGNAMVRAAYSCGKPALGVGAGNVPVYIESSAKLGRAVNDVVLSKAFDNGMICASEQALIVDDGIYDQALAEARRLHAHLVSAEEKRLLEQLVFGVTADGTSCSGAKLNASVVGQTAPWIARAAGFEVPADTSILLAEVSSVGPQEPLTREKLCPVLAVLRADSSEHGVDLARQMVEFDGLGHSAAIHSEDTALVERFGRTVPAVRIIANAPSSLGGIGDIYNAFVPSLTLGCGSYGRNSVSHNVSAVDLVNIKRIGRRTNNLQWFKVPAKTYFEPYAIRYLMDMPDVERVSIVTDSTMTTLGFVDRVIEVLNRRPGGRVALQIIDQVEPEPSVRTVQAGAAQMRHFRPDTIIALGGGSPMDAAKVMWLLYENPETNFSDLRQKFFDVRKRAFRFPTLGKLAKLVCVPTTSGTGAEVTPFAVITDETGRKYPLADYALTPTVAIIDPELTGKMPASLAADSGFDALTHATEAFVSVYANDFTDGMALHAIRLIFENLRRSVNGAPGDPETVRAREKMHNAGSIAGMAFGNAFLGIVHAMAHTIGSRYHLVHGRTNATLLPHVVRYNGTIPTKLTSWPKYERYIAPERFAEIAKVLGLPASTPEEGVESYAQAIEELRSDVGIPDSFQAQGVCEELFMSELDILAMGSYEDQCAPANPRMPMLEDMKELMASAYYGIRLEELRARGELAQAVPEPALG